MRAKRRARQFERIAYHEAGHVVAAHVRHRRYTYVSIIPDEEFAGRCGLARWSKSWWEDAIYSPWEHRTRVETDIIVSCAGVIAERLRFGSYRGTRSARQSDMTKVGDWAVEMIVDPKERDLYIGWLWEHTRVLLEGREWMAVEAIAGVLLEEQRIGQRRARQIIKDAFEKWLPDGLAGQDPPNVK